MKLKIVDDTKFSNKPFFFLEDIFDFSRIWLKVIWKQKSKFILTIYLYNFSVPQTYDLLWIYSLRIMWSTFAVGFSWTGTWWCYARWCRYINAWRTTVKSTLWWFGWDCRQPKYLRTQTKNNFTLFERN